MLAEQALVSLIDNLATVAPDAPVAIDTAVPIVIYRRTGTSDIQRNLDCSILSYETEFELTLCHNVLVTLQSLRTSVFNALDTIKVSDGGSGHYYFEWVNEYHDEEVMLDTFHVTLVFACYFTNG